MKGTRAELRYAKAILNLAKEKGKESEVNNDMLLVAKTIKENNDLEIMLNSPIIKNDVKENAIKAVFSGKVSNITLGLFHLLQDNKRLGLLYIVAKQYSIIYDYLKHIDTAKVTTAFPLTKGLEDKILEKVVELTGNKATIENEINPDVLGGFILRVGDVQYDASISNYLNELRKEFDHSHYIPKI